MKRISWIITIPVTLVVVVFAIANRTPITVNFWPLPWVAQLSLYLVILGSLLAGFLIGAAIAWLSAGRRRQEARRTAERLRGLTAELAQMQRQQGATIDGTAARLPAPR
jgi:lipopolysaccharide assembly protein A